MSKSLASKDYDYLNGSGTPSYITDFRVFCSLVQPAESPLAPIPTLDQARHAIANRRDMLVGRQRRRFSKKRKSEIDFLANAYDSVYARMLKMGFK